MVEVHDLTFGPFFIQIKQHNFRSQPTVHERIGKGDSDISRADDGNSIRSRYT